MTKEQREQCAKHVGKYLGAWLRKERLDRQDGCEEDQRAIMWLSKAATCVSGAAALPLDEVLVPEEL